MRRLAFETLAGLLAVALLATLVRSPYLLDVMAYAGVLALFALGVAVTFGQLGYVSFGHSAFFGLGAYAAGLLATRLGWDYWFCVPLAVAPGLLLGALLGVTTARLSGAYFAIVTLVVAEVLVLLFVHWADFTGGPMGLMVTLGDPPAAAAVGWNAQQGYLFVVGAALVLAFLLVRNLRGSVTGRNWTAIREAPALAESLGIATARTRVLNVALSGGLSAFAGALLVPKALVLSPALFGAQYSATGILAVVLGGKTTLIGPLIGGALFAVLPEGLRFLGELNFAAFALLLLIAVRVLPRGLVGTWPIGAPGRPRDGAGAKPVAVPADTTTDTPAAQTTPPLAAATPPAMQSTTKPATQSDVVLSLSGVSRHFSGLKAVQDVSFDVRGGEIVGLIGPNGAGKTTLLSLLSGFLAPSAGSVRAFGADIAGLRPHQLARRGVVRSFQQTAVCAGQSVAVNMLIASHRRRPHALWGAVLRTAGARRAEAERRDHALACLREVGLDERWDQIAGSLPYGEQKLLGVAMALAADPRVLLLDEPAAGLNQAEAGRLARVLRTLSAKGMTLVVVDHNLKMLMSIADRVVVLHHGVKLAEGTPAQVTTQADVVQAYLGGMEGGTPDSTPDGAAPRTPEAAGTGAGAAGSPRKAVA